MLDALRLEPICDLEFDDAEAVGTVIPLPGDDLPQVIALVLCIRAQGARIEQFLGLVQPKLRNFERNGLHLTVQINEASDSVLVVQQAENLLRTLLLKLVYPFGVLEHLLQQFIFFGGAPLTP